MVSKAFSFRLPDQAVQALESQGLENETLNQTAQRVLMEALGLTTKPSASRTTFLDIQELVKQEVEKAIAQSQFSTPANDVDVQELVKQELEKAINQSSLSTPASNVDLQELVKKEVESILSQKLLEIVSNLDSNLACRCEDQLDEFKETVDRLLVNMATRLDAYAEQMSEASSRKTPNLASKTPTPSPAPSNRRKGKPKTLEDYEELARQAEEKRKQQEAKEQEEIDKILEKVGY